MLGHFSKQENVVILRILTWTVQHRPGRDDEEEKDVVAAA